MALPPPTNGSTILVTGASAGIGAELARGLAARGYGVTLVARREERLRALADELGSGAEVAACDLADAAARQALVAGLERQVTGVCNNAGFGSVGRFAELDAERELRLVRVNVEAVVELTRAFLPGMLEAGAGAVLNVASIAAYQPLPGFAAYAASKAFVQSFSEAVHEELAGTGVSVTCLSPGFTHTEFGAAAGSEGSLPGFIYGDARDVAEAGIEAMLAGRRSAIPGLANRASMLGGRVAPRSLLLPLVRQVTDRLR
jgi:short-subunit dehydrogenase